MWENIFYHSAKLKISANILTTCLQTVKIKGCVWDYHRMHEIRDETVIKLKRMRYFYWWHCRKNVFVCMRACLTKGCCTSLTFTSLVHFKSSTQQKLTFSFLNLSLCTATVPDTEHWRLIHFCRSLSVPIACPLWLSWNAKQWQRYYGNTAFVLITALSDGN